MRAAWIIAGILCIAPDRAAAQAVEWWRIPQYQRELGLTSKQSAAIEHLFRMTLDERRALRDKLDRTEAALQNAFTEGDENEAIQLISEVENARAARNTARTMMLVRIYWVLSPQQRQRLKMLTNRSGP